MSGATTKLTPALTGVALIATLALAPAAGAAPAMDRMGVVEDGLTDASPGQRTFRIVRSR